MTRGASYLIDPNTPEFVRVLERIDRLSMLLDAQFRIPLTKIHFGWDAVVGLIPLAGDLLMAAVSVSLIRDARKLGARRHSIVCMGGHTLIDLLLGAIPFIGPVFDAFYRANLRNLQLLLDEINERQLPHAAATHSQLGTGPNRICRPD
jgi:hypothetical protein